MFHEINVNFPKCLSTGLPREKKEELSDSDSEALIEVL